MFVWESLCTVKEAKRKLRQSCKNEESTWRTKEGEYMDYLSTCRISRQITILQRNPERSSNRLTKKKMQLLLLSFEKSLCTRWNKNSSNLLKVFFLLKIGKKSRDVKNKMRRMWITWLSDFSTRRHYCLRKSSLHTRWSKLSSNLLEKKLFSKLQKIKRHEEENRRRPRTWIYLSVEFFNRSQFCDAIQNARVTDWRRRRRRKRCHCCLRKSCLY